MKQLADSPETPLSETWQSGRAAQICRGTGADLPLLAALRAGTKRVVEPRRAAPTAYLFQDSVKTVEDDTFRLAQSADNSKKTQEQSKCHAY